MNQQINIAYPVRPHRNSFELTGVGNTTVSGLMDYEFKLPFDVF